MPMKNSSTTSTLSPKKEEKKSTSNYRYPILVDCTVLSSLPISMLPFYERYGL